MKKLVTLAILMAMAISIFGTASVFATETERVWTTVLEEDFSGDFSKWDNAPTSPAITDGALDFSTGQWFLQPKNTFSEALSIEFDSLKVGGGMAIRIQDNEGALRTLMFKALHEVANCQLFDGSSYYPAFGVALRPDKTVSTKFVIDDSGVTMYTKEINEGEEAYTKAGESYVDSVDGIDMFKDGNTFRIFDIYYLGSLTPVDATFIHGDETITTTVYPNVIDNIKIKNVKYGTQKFNTIFSDDFASGSLDKWIAGASLVCSNGAVGMNAFDQYLVPNNFAGLDDFMIEFDATGWMNNFYVLFTDNSDSTNSFRVKINDHYLYPAQVTDNAYSIWVDIPNAGLSGGSDEAPNKNSMRLIYSKGVLSIYRKTPSDSDFVYCGSHSYEANDGLINKDAKYVPGFYVIGGTDGRAVDSVLIDNVAIKTIEPVSVSAGAKTLVEDFSSANWADNWDGIPGGYYAVDPLVGLAEKVGNPYTWNENGSAYLYMWGNTIYPKNNISAKELTAELTFDTTNAVGTNLYLQFTNVDNYGDFVRIKLQDTCVEANPDGGGVFLIMPGVSLNNENKRNTFETFEYKLTSDKLTVTKKTDGTSAVLSGDDFKAAFTEGATYMAGICTIIPCNEAAPVYIDSFKVETAPSATLTANLSTETGKDSYGLTAKVAAGEKYKLNLDVDGTVDGQLIIAVYDGAKLAGVKVADVASGDFEFVVAENVENPSVKVMVWDALTGMTPVTDAIIYTAE